jgi:hypothetical protein
MSHASLARLVGRRENGTSHDTVRDGFLRLNRQAIRKIAMPLHTPGDNNPIRRVPHSAEYMLWRSRLTPVQIRAIEDDLDARIDAKVCARSLQLLWRVRAW